MDALEAEVAHWRREAARLKKENDRLGRKVTAAETLTSKVDALIGHFEEQEEAHAQQLQKVEEQAAVEVQELRTELRAAERNSPTSPVSPSDADDTLRSELLRLQAEFAAPCRSCGSQLAAPAGETGSRADLAAWQWARLAVAMASSAHLKGLLRKRRSHRAGAKTPRSGLRTPRAVAAAPSGGEAAAT